jgi:hypothetical protein
MLLKRDFQTEKEFADTEWMRSGGMSSLSEDAPVCPQCGGYVGGLIWIPPYKIELEMYTKQFGNVVLGSGNDLVVDDYFKSRFEETDLTGLEFSGEAEVVKLICRWGVKKKQLGEPPKYYVARIKYGCAAIDHEKSGSVFHLKRHPTCDYCRVGLIMRYSKIVIDESTWDGTDIFLARGVGGMITTSQRFKDWWDSCNFNNCKVIPADEEHVDYHRDMSPEEDAYRSKYGYKVPWPPTTESEEELLKIDPEVAIHIRIHESLKQLEQKRLAKK